MRNKLLAIVLLLLWMIPIAAQQGTVILKDTTSSTQASVKAAGTVTPNVLGVQGNASGIPLPVSGTVTATQGTGGSNPWTVTTSSCSGGTCYTTPVAFGAVVVATGSTSQPLASTTDLKSLKCNNQNTASVNFTATDGNNVYFVGPNYVFAALSSVEFVPNGQGSILTSGLKMSAGTASSITCWGKGGQ